MKKIVVLMTLSSFFTLSSTAMAKEAKNKTMKTKAHECAMYTKNAKKARQLYSENKTQAVAEFDQVKALKSDQKRMPANAKVAKQVVDRKIDSLYKAKRQHLMNSLKYLEKHIQYVKAAKRSCASHKATIKNKVKKQKMFRGQDIDKYLSVASH